MDKIIKTFRPEVKAVDADEGTIDMLIPMSTASVDRDNESIDPQGWKKSLPAFRKRPVLLSSHDYSDLRKQIGEFVSIKVTEEGLFAKPKYYINEGNEEADWAFRLASKGVAAYSVGFIPIKWEDGDGDKGPRRTYLEQELLEISHVVVPSNRDAIQGVRGKSANPLINQLVEEILSADLVDLTETDKVTKPEDTGDFIKIPVDDGDHEGHKRRTIQIDKEAGIQALYCVDCKKVLTYIFDKEKGWTMEKAKEWVKEHKNDQRSLDEGSTTCRTAVASLGTAGSTDFARAYSAVMGKQRQQVSQGEIKDEIDYVRGLVADFGLNPEGKTQAWELVRQIMRSTGNDIPDDIVLQIIRDKGIALSIPARSETVSETEISDAVKRILDRKLKGG